MKKALTILVIAALLFFGILLGLQKRFYMTISQETLIGIARCIPSRDKNFDFYLYYFPVIDGKESDFILIKLKGRDWAFEGEIIKWGRPLNVMGIKTIQRPIRIYDSAGDYYPLATRRKEIFFKTAGMLPFVDTRFISIAKQRYAPKIKFGIYATNTGYLVRKIR